MEPNTPLTTEASDRETTRQQRDQPAYFDEQKRKSRVKMAGLMIILLLLVIQTSNQGLSQLTSGQGWASVLYPQMVTQNNILPVINQAGHIDQTTTRHQASLTPQQYIDLIVSHLTRDQKLGQMMMVQFVGANYSEALASMLNQYHVGNILLFSANGNIIDKDQLKSLTQNIRQASSALPPSIALDQEGGTVDRLQQLDGPRPSEAEIGATNSIEYARTIGKQTAADLTSYGINLNLAPVVDVDNDPTSELHQDMRTFGTTSDSVTRMAGAYLQGLQESQQVVGTLKHFPGLGDASVDPHVGLPTITRSKAELENTDWAPYHALIMQGLVHAIMVTHEMIPAIDPNKPSSLSPALVQGILRQEMGFQGVIMTDSLTMAGIAAYYSPDQAAALAIEAGSDIIMGASSPDEVATMLNGIKQALDTGTLQPARIDQSVRRILLMKYQMGLLPIPKQ
ncbi:glycoside hydrolase family 3 protein [Dictyobacter arantiisoli]|uniref:beta-N-acetylhexosaminidase n=1 Tax=Dictyobacter arantiisoli TaxID=2014874 RepID=A0A5A5TCF7_9CHLR|nr:glycoside hydrolase family 3 N-terminal domain-containing protein [Dictyobacter arantiisoli]GCF09132.1 hypothetical protein KDI_26960 [Dictyobacter arantiisoli]